MSNTHKSVLAMSVYQNVKPNTFKNIIEVLRQDKNIKFDLEYDDALISRSRNLIATRFLQSNYKVLIFIDDDIYFLPEHYFRLETLCLNGYDIVGGFYPTRSGKSCASRLAKGVSVKMPIKNSEPVPAEYVSTGFMAINRKIFEKLISDNKVSLAYSDREKYSDVEPYYPFFEAKWHEGEWLSEDWGFCNIAKESGFKCWLAPDVFLGHEGRYLYTLRDAFRPAIDNSKIVELVRK